MGRVLPTGGTGDLLQWPVLPGLDLLQHTIRDLRYSVVGQVGTQHAGQVMLAVPHRHPTRIQQDDHLAGPPARRAPLGTSRGVNIPVRSRGTSSRTSPTSVATVIGVVPLREFGLPRPARSPFS
jgi:hypothetical protein